MDAAEVVHAVLADAAGEALHWTVIWDRALQAGLLNPLEDPQARAKLQRALADEAAAGRITKTSTGTYRGSGSAGSDVGPSGHAG